MRKKKTSINGGIRHGRPIELSNQHDCSWKLLLETTISDYINVVVDDDDDDDDDGR